MHQDGIEHHEPAGHFLNLSNDLVLEVVEVLHNQDKRWFQPSIIDACCWYATTPKSMRVSALRHLECTTY